MPANQRIHDERQAGDTAVRRSELSLRPGPGPRRWRSFLENGIIDSTGVLELVAHLEETYDVKVQDDELIPDNLDSIDAIVAYLARKRTVEACMSRDRRPIRELDSRVMCGIAGILNLDDAHPRG